MRVVGELDSRGRERVQTVNEEESMTVQSDAHLAELGNILKNYGALGMEMLDETALEFRDISEFTDLADALNQAKKAEVQFMTLPSKVREIYGHDVAQWLDTAHDKDKRDALVEAGFIKADEVVEEKPKGKPVDPAGAKVEEGTSEGAE